MQRKFCFCKFVDEAEGEILINLYGCSWYLMMALLLKIRR